MSEVESAHAQEHWLRMAANRAVDIALEAPAWGGDTVFQDLLGNAALRMETALADTDETLPKREQVERAVAYLLRAAVMLRRQEAGR